MARAKQVKAGKDYPALGIKKGELHWFAEVKTGPRSSKTIRSKNPIPRSQLTSSEFLSTAYDLSDRLGNATELSELEDIKSELETLRDETQEKLDNMPDGLRDGPTGELLQERVDQLESLISEVESAYDAAETAMNDGDDGDEPSDDDGEDEVTVTEAEAVKSAVEDNVSSTF